MNLKQITIASLLLSSVSFGASIDLIQNYSAEYGGNPAQQGAINYGSTVYFNPAGLSQLEKGTYFVGGVQLASGKQTMTDGDYNNKGFDTDLFSPIPNFAVYKVVDDGAYFWTLGAYAGGAALEYEDGIPLPGVKDIMKDKISSLSPQALTNPQLGALLQMNMNDVLTGTNVKGSNQYIQTTIGRTWKVDEKLSTSFGVKAVYGMRNLKANTSFKDGLSLPIGNGIPLDGSASIDSERTGYGFGFQLGLNYKATEKLNIAFRYDSQVNMDFKTKADIKSTNAGSIIVGSSKPGEQGGLLGMFPVYDDGTKIRRDLPAILALGASYKVTDRWTTFIGGNYYFNKDAKMDRHSELAPSKYDYDNGWEISLGSEYWINEKFAWLAGFNYADTGAKETTFAATEYAINSFSVGTGIKYRQNETTEWTFAYNHYFYDETSFAGTEYEKKIASIGFNFVKKF